MSIPGSGGSRWIRFGPPAAGMGRLSGNARRSMERGYPSRSVTAVGFAGASKASTESAFIV